MQNNFNRASADPQPDFRRMTPEEMKAGITTLNGVIRDLRRFVSTANPKTLGEWKEGTQAAARLAKIFPSSALVNRLADTPLMRNGETSRGFVGLAYPLIDEAVDLRAKYKTVWRARPGRKQYNLSKRIGRENVRKATKIAKDFPFMP